MNKKLIIAAVVALLAVSVVYFFALFSAQESSELNQDEAGNTVIHKASELSRDQAINEAIAKYPELAAYKTEALPPSSIEAKKSGQIWYLGFIQSGSGVPGILNAKCYQVINAGSVAPVGRFTGEPDKVAESIKLETCSPVYKEIPAPTYNPYGKVTLKINQSASFKDITIKPLAIEEDSRCPADVQCIWAGTVRVKVEIVTIKGVNTGILKLGEALSSEGFALELMEVDPNKVSKVTIGPADYSFVISVSVGPAAAKPVPQAKCYIGGCSSQLCTDSPDAVSTCEYRAEYACYRSASCKRQADGRCGWTPTAQLTACLASPPKMLP